MKYKEIVAPPSHPYVVALAIDPIDLQRLQRMADNRPELQFLDYDSSLPDNWAVRIGCASRAVASGLEENWN
jgi:hypothetical protein